MLPVVAVVVVVVQELLYELRSSRPRLRAERASERATDGHDQPKATDRQAARILFSSLASCIQNSGGVVGDDDDGGGGGGDSNSSITLTEPDWRGPTRKRWKVSSRTGVRSSLFKLSPSLGSRNPHSLPLSGSRLLEKHFDQFRAHFLHHTSSSADVWTG